jgi:hypothetical protein
LATVAGVIAGAVAGCAGGAAPTAAGAGQGRLERIVAAPRELLSAGQPQPNGTIWTLAGDQSGKGLFQLDLATGRSVGSVSVSNAARSVAESLSGVIGLALGAGRAGALELLNGGTGKATATIALGAPAREVVVGSDGTTFYALNGTPSSASVTVVNSHAGSAQGTVPVPLSTVSFVPDVGGSELYTLQPDGQVSEIAVAGGKLMSSFSTGGSGGRSLALSPDGSTLYVLKDTGGTANVAAVNLATQAVQRVLPAAAGSQQVLVSADGTQLYDLVGTPAYGNIQVTGA